ncbi:MAG: beta-propeller fold lactonase family protein, partial [Myxococcota bacterium]
GIHRFELNRGTQQLDLLGVTAPSTRSDAIDVNPESRLLYVSETTNDAVTAYTLESDGDLSPIATSDLGFRPVYIALDRTRNVLLSASFGDNRVGSFAIDGTGAVIEGSLATPATGMRPHAIITDPTASFAFVPCRDTFNVFQYRLEANGALTSNAVASADAPSGGGPRHIEFHPSLDVVYVNNEMGDSISWYSYDPTEGRLTLVDTLSSLPESVDGGDNTTADVALTPDGQFLYVSNRGHDSIARFSIGADGALAVLGHTPSPERPRSMDIDPSGTYLAVSGQDDDQTELFRIGPDGNLSSVHSVVTAAAPTWVEFVFVPAAP